LSTVENSATNGWKQNFSNGNQNNNNKTNANYVRAVSKIFKSFGMQIEHANRTM